MDWAASEPTAACSTFFVVTSPRVLAEFAAVLPYSAEPVSPLGPVKEVREAPSSAPYWYLPTDAPVSEPVVAVVVSSCGL